MYLEKKELNSFFNIFFYICNMNYSQLQEELNAKTLEFQQLTKQTRRINNEMSDIRGKISELESNLLLEFVGLENKIEISRFVSFSGKQINLKNTPFLNINTGQKSNIWRPNFNTGDEIEVIKKNKISVVIRCTKKFVNNNSVNPNSQFRISFDDFKNFIIRNTGYYEKFKIWIKRKESLDSLLG